MGREESTTTPNAAATSSQVAASGAYMTGYDFVVANRLAVNRITEPDGTIGWQRSPGGLVTALAPIMAESQGAWIGWHGAADEALEPFDHSGLHLHPVPLSAQEVEDYYEGFSNGTLWPLYHDVIARPQFHRHWFDAYRRVRSAAAAAQVASMGATVWVQDYQLQLVPQILRELRSDLKIGFFNHIPFPPPGLFAQLPWRHSVMRGLLGADLIGFQRESDAGNFQRVVRSRLGHYIKSGRIYVAPGGQRGGRPPGRVQCGPGPRHGLTAAERHRIRGPTGSRRPRPIPSPSTPRRSSIWRRTPRSLPGLLRSGGSGAPEDDSSGRGPAGLHQGHSPPDEGLRGAAERRRPERRRCLPGPDRLTLGVRGSSPTSCCAKRSKGPWAGSTASSTQ